MKIKRIPDRKTRIAYLSRQDLADLFLGLGTALASRPSLPKSQWLTPEDAEAEGTRLAWVRMSRALWRAGAR